MSTVLDYLGDIRAGEVVGGARCPACNAKGVWWRPRDEDRNTTLGIRCTPCGYVIPDDLNPGPPTILCAVCGQPLHKSVHDDTVFTCRGCGRRVTA